MTTTLTQMARAIGDRLLIQGIDPANMPCSYLDDLARAALEAMREPSEGMLRAGGSTPGMEEVNGMICHLAMVRNWPLSAASVADPPLAQAHRAMIDHALNEKGKE